MSTMFDQADSRSAVARALYKKYADRSVRHEPVFSKRDFVFLSRPPDKAKTAREKAEDLAQSKLRLKTLGPFEVIDANAETVTIIWDRLPLTVSIDRCVEDPGSGREPAENQQQPLKDLGADFNESNHRSSNESMHQQKYSNETNQK